MYYLRHISWVEVRGIVLGVFSEMISINGGRPLYFLPLNAVLILSSAK